MAQPTVAVTGNGVALAADQTYIFPADRCTWQQAASADGRGYSISQAHFWPGVAVTQPGTAGGPTQDAVQLSNEVLGVIGKSGRFVAITDAN